MHSRLGQTLPVRWRGPPDAKQNPVREAMVWYVASGLAAVVLVSLLGVWLFSRAGEAEAIRDAKDQTRIAAEGSVEPVLSDALVRGDPRALATLDRVVQERVLSDASIMRVKIWDRSGRVVYSDEPRPHRGAIRPQPKRPRGVQRPAGRCCSDQSLEAGESV